MRQRVSLGVVVVVIVVVLAIVAGIGYSVLRSKKGPQDMPEDARQMFEEQQKKASQERGGPPGKGPQQMPEDARRMFEEQQKKTHEERGGAGGGG